VFDESKLPSGMWARMLWLPPDDIDESERPIVLITDRRRSLTGGVPMIVAFVVAIVLFLVRAPSAIVLLFLVISIAAGIYARGGRNGYYEVAKDGSLGEFLGRRVPIGLRSMRRTRP
jgi:hypothetical protein